jgi:hypothetical protein
VWFCYQCQQWQEKQGRGLVSFHCCKQFIWSVAQRFEKSKHLDKARVAHTLRVEVGADNRVGRPFENIAPLTKAGVSLAGMPARL